jgi:nicotinamidase-related amidase
MPDKNVDLHGSAPDKHKFALLLIDVINDFDFPEAGQLLKHARPMARTLLRLKRRAQKAGVPVIYVNDNFGRWKSDFRRTVDYCARHGHGRDIVRLLRPRRKRLLRAQTKAFGVLFYHPRDPFPLLGNPNFNSYRYRWEFLRPFYRKRCLHARF